MKRRILLLLACVLTVAGSAWARPVDATTARRVAETYLRAQGMRNVEALVDVTAQTPFTEFYVFVAEDGGFILVSADDCVVPVLGWSASNRFSTKDMPENVRGWLNGYEQEIRRIKQRVESGEWRVESGERRAVIDEWEDLNNGVVPEPVLQEAVSPLLSTTWDQSPYYNDLCPYDNNTSARSVTGCVATATAQIMKYHGHPTTGYGSNTYTSQRTINGVTYTFSNLTANFGTTTYQWSSMPNALTGASSTAQVNAVATLMYHIGVAVEMSYSPVASGASNYNYYGTIQPSSQTALTRNFKYRPDMAPISRADYSDAAFATLLRAELDLQRPILFSGSNVSAGHSFVLDGYNTNGQFHVNWGWGSYLDGYFVIGSLNPGVGGTGGNSSGTYNMENIALLGIQPNTNWSTTGTTVITTSSTGNGTASGGGSYVFGDTVQLTATANAGYRFDGWSDGCKFNPREIIATGGSYTFTANFVAVTGDTLHYCPGGRCISNYRSTSGATYWGIKLPQSLLNPSDSLRAVQLYVMAEGSYNLTVYTGVSHSTTAATATVTYGTSDLNQWKTITLGTPVAATQDIWIVFQYSGTGYPASYTYGSGVAHSFLWTSSLYQDGISWGVTAMIKGIFGNGGTPDPGPNPCYITSFPYSENFNDTSALCWNVIDSNADGTTWTLFNPTYGYSNTICIGIQYADNSDDWLLAPPMNIAGDYTVAWKARAMSASYPETYQVLWYDGTDTTLLFQETLTSTTYVDRSTNFTVPESSSGRIVFRYISDDMYALFLDNIVISQYTAPTQYTITVQSNNPAWGTVTGGGTYDVGTPVTLTATPASGYHFLYWQDGLTTNPRTVVVTGNTTYTAIFEAIPPTQYTITVQSNNAAWGSVTGGGTYNEGTAVTLTATPASGYHFVQWQDGLTANPRTVVVTANATYTATFEADNNCPPVTAFPYTESFDASLGCWTAIDANSDNSTWRYLTSITGSSESVLPHSGNGMVGTFSWNSTAMHADEYLVSPQFVLPAGQTVTLSWWFRVNGSYPEDKLAVRLSTTGDAVANFTTTLIDITPTAANGSWTQQTLDLSAYAGQSVYLAFHHHDSYDANYLVVDDIQITVAAAPPTPTQYTITVQSNNAAWGTVTGGGTYDEGTSVTLTATPNSGYRFVQWQDGVTTNSRSVTVTGNATYTATFAPTEGIDEVEPQAISLYPNPAGDWVNIVVAEQGELSVMDVMGRTVFTQTIKQSGSQTITLDVSSLPDGVYFVKMGTHRSSLIIQH